MSRRRKTQLQVPIRARGIQVPRKTQLQRTPKTQLQVPLRTQLQGGAIKKGAIMPPLLKSYSISGKKFQKFRHNLQMTKTLRRSARENREYLKKLPTLIRGLMRQEQGVKKGPAKVMLRNKINELVKTENELKSLYLSKVKKLKRTIKVKVPAINPRIAGSMGGVRIKVYNEMTGKRIPYPPRIANEITRFLNAKSLQKELNISYKEALVREKLARKKKI